jgi:hypothetical protein
MQVIISAQQHASLIKKPRSKEWGSMTNLFRKINFSACKPVQSYKNTKDDEKDFTQNMLHSYLSPYRRGRIFVFCKSLG